MIDDILKDQYEKAVDDYDEGRHPSDFLKYDVDGFYLMDLLHIKYPITIDDLHDRISLQFKTMLGVDVDHDMLSDFMGNVLQNVIDNYNEDKLVD